MCRFREKILGERLLGWTGTGCPSHSGNWRARCRFRGRGFSDFLDLYNPQFPDGMVGPECDEKIPDENELYLAPGVIRLGVIADLGWIVGKLIEKPDQFLLPDFGESCEKPGGFGGENRLNIGDSLIFQGGEQDEHVIDQIAAAQREELEQEIAGLEKEVERMRSVAS